MGKVKEVFIAGQSSHHLTSPLAHLLVLMQVFLPFKLQAGRLYKCYRMTATGKELSQAVGEAVQTCHGHDWFVRIKSYFC